MKLLCSLLLLVWAAFASAAELAPGAHRIVFLGDSITHAGGYVDEFAAAVLSENPKREVTILNLGLPSETVSGLSEEGHADGKFPRPILSERLARVLEKTKPDLVFACYGMNDGIYLPPAEERLAKFREGMEALHKAVEAAGAKIIHLTPPVFDAVALHGRVSEDGKGKPYQGYDEVLTREAEWLLAQRAKGWTVIDLHTPMKTALEEKRKTDPDFAFSRDGVHADAAGHHVLAQALLAGLGHADAPAPKPDFLKLVHQEQQVLKDAWLQECGHLRPGVAKGLPVSEAQAKAAEIRAKIAAQAS